MQKGWSTMPHLALSEKTNKIDHYQWDQYRKKYTRVNLEIKRDSIADPRDI